MKLKLEEYLRKYVEVHLLYEGTYTLHVNVDEPIGTLVPMNKPLLKLPEELPYSSRRGHFASNE